jgi:hypothetical protein
LRAPEKLRQVPGIFSRGLITRISRAVVVEANGEIASEAQDVVAVLIETT